MNEIFRVFCFCAVFLLNCDAHNNVLDTLVPELYSLYKEAFITDKKYLTRRIFKGDQQFLLHVQKLREINGLKTHNLKVEQQSALRDSSTNILYINNPIEAELPNAFLTIEEFKNAMAKQIEGQKKEFKLYKKIHPMHKIVKKIKRPSKIEFGNIGSNIFTPVFLENQFSPSTQTDKEDKIESFFGNLDNEITARVYNIINYRNVNSWTRATTTATIEAKMLITSKVKSKHTRNVTIAATEFTTETTTEPTTEPEEETETWTEPTFNAETDALVEETTNKPNDNGNEEETTVNVKSSLRTRIAVSVTFALLLLAVI